MPPNFQFGLCGFCGTLIFFAFQIWVRNEGGWWGDGCRPMGTMNDSMATFGSMSYATRYCEPSSCRLESVRGSKLPQSLSSWSCKSTALAACPAHFLRSRCSWSSLEGDQDNQSISIASAWSQDWMYRLCGHNLEFKRR